MTELPENIAALPRHSVDGRPKLWCFSAPGSLTHDDAFDGLVELAIAQKSCWICGRPNGRFLCFVVTATAALRRESPEPPCHTSCAEWAVVNNALVGTIDPRVFLSNKQPGFRLIWTARETDVVILDEDGDRRAVFTLAEPTSLASYQDCQPASRAAFLDAINGAAWPIADAAMETGDATAADKLTNTVFLINKALPAEPAAA